MNDKQKICLMVTIGSLVTTYLGYEIGGVKWFNGTSYDKGLFEVNWVLIISSFLLASSFFGIFLFAPKDWGKREPK